MEVHPFSRHFGELSFDYAEINAQTSFQASSHLATFRSPVFSMHRLFSCRGTAIPGGLVYFLLLRPLKGWKVHRVAGLCVVHRNARKKNNSLNSHSFSLSFDSGKLVPQDVPSFPHPFSHSFIHRLRTSYPLQALGQVPGIERYRRRSSCQGAHRPDGATNRPTGPVGTPGMTAGECSRGWKLIQGSLGGPSRGSHC